MQIFYFFRPLFIHSAFHLPLTQNTKNNQVLSQERSIVYHSTGHKVNLPSCRTQTSIRKSMSYRLVGNTAHAVNILVVFFYGQMTIFSEKNSSGQIQVLDSRWLEEGFCIPENSNVEDMHLDSGLILSLISFAFIAFLYWTNLKEVQIVDDENIDSVNSEKDNEMEKVFKYVVVAMVGVVGHAFGHFLIFESIRAGMYPDGDTVGMMDMKNDSIFLVMRKTIPGYLLFWVPLIKSYMQNTSWTVSLLLAKLAMFMSLQNPIKFGFAFAQCFFFLCLSIDQLVFVQKEDKGLAFAVYPFVTVLPNLLISCIEAKTCSTLPLMKAAGHVLYDAYMGCSYVLFYVICKILNERIAKKIKIKSA